MKEGSDLYTDEWVGYNGLDRVYNHQIVKHSFGEYVNDRVHVNRVEGCWSLLKRGVVGIYHSTSKKHLGKYVDEFVFRYNNRLINSEQRFRLTLASVSVGHISYNQLIQKNAKGEEKTSGKSAE